VNSKSPVSIRSDEHVFAVVCKMPAPPEISQHLLLVQNAAADKLDSNQDFPVIGTEFSIERAENFWKSFEELADKSSSIKKAIQTIEEYANIVENKFHKNIKSRLTLRENTAKNRDSTARGLARFIAWNYVLGFKKTIYCPFRIAEPFSEGESRLVSWGGGILVLSNTFPLKNILHDIISSTEASFPYAFDKSIENSLLELILGIRLFVDVATPKVIFGDWKYYQRTLESNTISKSHAEGITQGLEHEIRALQSLVSLNIENPKRKEIVDVELEVSLQISKLVWMSYVDRDKSLQLSELMTRLREIVTWRTLVIKDNHASLSDPDISVPFPLLFVLAELCRNAYKYSTGNPERTKREVNITFKTEGDVLVSVNVRNKTNNTQTSPITCDSRVSKKTKMLGLTIVMKIVCDMLGGAFSFLINEEGQAIASFSFSRSKTYETHK
jgi:two-component sensor histidine kinase